MTLSRTTLVFIGVSCLLAVVHAAAKGAAPPAAAKGKRTPPAPLPIGFLGWNYEKIGYTLSPGENVALRFRNNRDAKVQTPVRWTLSTYAGQPIGQGEATLTMNPHEPGEVSLAIPSTLEDGPHWIKFALGDAPDSAIRSFYFDYRKPKPDPGLNLNVVALVENMDAEGWVRTMLGGFSDYINVLTDWPDDEAFAIDAVLVIAEGLKGDDPRAARLRQYVRRGGKMLVLGRPPASLAEMLQEDVKQRTATRDWVFEKQPLAPPKDFVVVGRNNIGRFGWLIDEGALTENIASDGVVWHPTDQNAVFSLSPKGAFPISVSVEGAGKPEAGAVKQNWLSKTIQWKYGNGKNVHSTLSLASPAILWEGDAKRLTLDKWEATHLAYISPKGIRVVAAGGAIDPADMAENWLVTFIAKDNTRDVPRLIVLTRRPARIDFTKEIAFVFDGKGFGALFTSSLWGLRRFAPGETISWEKKVPPDAVAAARQWSRAFLSYPVQCEEIGWLEAGAVCLADRFRFRAFADGWKTSPLTLAALPPVLSLARGIGVPIDAPPEAKDMHYATKFGPLEALPGDATLVRIHLPAMDHRAIIPVEGRLELQQAIDRHALEGLYLGRHIPDTGINAGNGERWDDLQAYFHSEKVPLEETACLDVYEWWLTFNAILGRPVYSPAARQQVDRHFHQRYWEILNCYAHKCIVMHRREPWTGIDYLISFIYPTQTQHGFRHFNDAEEASGINSYCFANYARYYGDWDTLRANWNLCRRLYEFLPKVNDWAVMASAAHEYYQVVGYDMLNSEYIGNLAFAYAAKNTGHKDDEIEGLVLAAKSLVASVARFGLKDFIESCTAADDPWRRLKGFYYFNEYGFQATASVPEGGGIGMLDTSKGTGHELALAYKEWVPKWMDAHEKDLGKGVAPHHQMHRVLLGWDREEIPARMKASAESAQAQPGKTWRLTKDVYDMAYVCVADIPLFLSEWAPAEYITGRYDPAKQEVALEFRSHEDGPYQVRLYSQRAAKQVTVNDEVLKAENGGWSYDPSTGGLVITLKSRQTSHVRISLGEPVASLHPYFTRVE